MYRYGCRHSCFENFNELRDVIVRRIILYTTRCSRRWILRKLINRVLSLAHYKLHMQLGYGKHSIGTCSLPLLHWLRTQDLLRFLRYHEKIHHCFPILAGAWIPIKPNLGQLRPPPSGSGSNHKCRSFGTPWKRSFEERLASSLRSPKNVPKRSSRTRERFAQFSANSTF